LWLLGVGCVALGIVATVIVIVTTPTARPGDPPVPSPSSERVRRVALLATIVIMWAAALFAWLVATESGFRDHPLQMAALASVVPPMMFRLGFLDS
jgi:hypothetical protein